MLSFICSGNVSEFCVARKWFKRCLLGLCFLNVRYIDVNRGNSSSQDSCVTSYVSVGCFF